MSPFFILFALVGLFPLGYTFVVSLHEWDLLTGQGPFVGLENFAEILGDRMFWNSISNTVSIFLLSSIPQLTVAIVVAYLLDQGLRAHDLAHGRAPPLRRHPPSPSPSSSRASSTRPTASRTTS